MHKALHRVTCKVALYNPDKTKVLVIELFENNFSLPGGHLEVGEAPDETLLRELHEELGIRGGDLHLERKDFWVHPDGKVILGFTGEIDDDTKMIVNPQEVKAAHWVNITDLQQGALTTGTYDQFILRGSAG